MDIDSNCPHENKVSLLKIDQRSRSKSVHQKYDDILTFEQIDTIETPDLLNNAYWRNT